jgi:hypothetical protein
MRIYRQARPEGGGEAYNQSVEVFSTMGERHWIDPRELIGENQFKPPHDEIFDMLFGLAMHGDLSVFFGAIPLQLIRPFSDEFKFASIPNGPEIITAIVDEALNGNFPRLRVYEKGEYFVMSDNYPGYEACIQGQPDFVPCWILGRPRNSLVEQVQGPVDARRVAGFSS